MLRTTAAFICIAWVLGSASGARAEGDLVCEDDYESCRETCTLQYGTSSDTHGKLMQCLSHCDDKKKGCLAKKNHRALDTSPEAPKAE